MYKKRGINMAFIYIIGGFLLMTLAVFFLDKREKMGHEMKKYAEYREEIEMTNRELTELEEQLAEMNEPLSKLDRFSREVLKHMK